MTVPADVGDPPTDKPAAWGPLCRAVKVNDSVTPTELWIPCDNNTIVKGMVSEHGEVGTLYLLGVIKHNNMQNVFWLL